MTTKILALTDALGNLVRFVLLPGHRFDTVGVAPLLEGIAFGGLIRLGLGPDEIRQRQRSFAVVRAATDFHRELRTGDVVALESAIVKLGEKSATFQHRLKNTATGEVAMTTEFKCALLDLEKREATTIPDDIRRAAGDLIES